MTIRRALAISIVALASLSPQIARAQDAATCKDGYDRSQVSRDSGKLIEAQRLLQQCSSATCSTFIQKECVGWLADVESRLPSVILSAKSGAGANLVDVTVTIDGNAGPTKLDGRSLNIDPGEHTFVFQLADGTKADQHVVIREREKGKVVAVTLGPVPATSPPAAPPSGSGAPAASSASSMKLVGFIAGGVGVAGLVVGTIAGLSASSDLSSPHCDANKQCEPGAVSSAKSAATISTIGFIAGGVLVASGVTLVLLAPKAPNGASADAKTARLGATPMIGINGGGMSLVGSW